MFYAAKKSMLRNAILIICIALIAWVAYGVNKDDPIGPKINGKQMSSWVCVYAKGDFSEKELAVKSIRQLGTNSIKYLVRWMEWDSTNVVFSEKYKNIRFPHRSLFVNSLSINEFSESCSKILPLLEDQVTSNVVRELIALQNESTRRQGWLHGANALSRMSDQTITLVLTGITNRNPQVQYHITYTLMQATNSGDCIVSNLLFYMNGDDMFVVNNAVHNIATLRLKPEIIMPVLIDKLNDARLAESKSIIMHAIGECGKSATSAIPVLQCYASSNSIYKQVAAEAMENIKSPKYR